MICTWIKIENEWYISCAGVKVKIVRTNSPAEFDKCPGCDRTIKSEVQMKYQKPTTAIPCRSCQTPIVFLKTTKGKNIPVDFDTLTESDKFDLQKGNKFFFRHGEHISHFATCPNAAQHRKPPEDKRYGD